MNLVTRAAFSRLSVGLSVAAALLVCVPAHATITFDATFDSSLSGADDAAINAAIANIEADITSPNNITVSIYFTSMSSGLGESLTGEYEPSYFQYYNAFKAVATQPDAVAALDSLGAAPVSSTSPDPVNTSDAVIITSPEGRNLGFDTPGVILPNSNINDATGGGTYDSEIALNTSITYPPGPNNGSNYDLQAVANHEIDETLGIGGTGSTLTGSGSLTAPVGDLDLYRYTCSIPVTTLIATLTCPADDVSRTYSASTPSGETPTSYFSINGGLTVLSFFNQTAGADYGDWLSDCSNLTVCQTNGLPQGFNPQVQDAFGIPSTDPSLGPNELAAFNAIGYQLVAPEPGTFALVGAVLLGAGFLRRRVQARKNG